ncbi:TIMELESS-interacting protein-like isoform X1 [Artemia franciscana]|uniref:TIMELESS-interacting protein n=1 Tax=Artemia franciscana TaxID=6661 RepID=A0AA88L929_ARTSF|nr:hypothetical protein QYM36_003232 [Artemia franciscana]
MEERIETYEEERVEIYAESNFDSADEAEEVSEGGKKDKEDNNGEPERVVPKKRTIRNPRPKLDENRLMSQKGLVALEQYFKDVELKGKGHELEDLDLIMGKLQLWVHRLFPRMKFDDSLEKIEALGHKKSIQSQLHRIRLGLDIPSHAQEIVEDTEYVAEQPLLSSDALFDNLLHEEKMPSVSGYASLQEIEKPTPKPVMTEELRRKIEENRRKAVERLKARQATSELSVATSAGLASPSVHIEKPIQVNANDSNSHAASETANSSFNFKERIGAEELDESLLTEIVNGVGPKSKAYERHVVEPLFESKHDTQNQEFDDKKLAAAKESVPLYFVVDDNSEGSSKLQLNNSHIDDPLADLDSEDDTRVSAPKKRRVAIIESDSD